MRTTTHATTKTTVLFWTAQALLAALFLFGGAIKLTIPAEALAEQARMNGTFLHFIGVMEVLGALGLVLPGLTGIGPRLTPLAALGLVIIMIGATVTSVISFGVAGGILPFVTGIVASGVAYGRWRVAPHRGRPVSADTRQEPLRTV